MNKGHSIHIKWAPYIFLMPFLLFFALFRLWPILWSLIISFFNYKDGEITHFIGLNNYILLFRDPRFLKSIGNTLYFVIVYNVIMIFLAIILAVMASSAFIRGRKVYRSIYFIPIAMSLPVVAMVFDMLFAKNIGFVSAIYGLFGAKYNLRLFASMDWAMWGVILMRVWRGTGYYCAYFLAGLTAIPHDVYESSKIDGAGPVTTFFRITLPLLKPMLIFVFIMSTILSFQLFDEPWILTQGGPANQTLTLQMYLYQKSFLEQDLSMGSAVSYIMTLLMMGASFVYVSRLSEKEGKKK